MNYDEYIERMKDNKYKELVVTKSGEDKPYVFISYRSDSWKKVLTEIVYKLQKEYGLRIYFDKDFASETNVWVEQFQKNMNSPFCKAFICFFDEGYVTSYATLIELMHAMNPKSKLKDSIFSINFNIDWKKLDDNGNNTGLGVKQGDNPGWKKEKEAFEDEFDLIKDDDEYKAVKAYYKRNDELRVCDCKDIMNIIQPKNRRPFADTKEFYEHFIIKPLKDKCPSVFEDVLKADVVNQENKLTASNNVEENRAYTLKNDIILKQDSESSVDVESIATPLSVNIPTTVSKATILRDFEKLCESVDFCVELGNARNKIRHGGKGLFDYLMAALLRGCDADIYDKKNNRVMRPAGYNYNKYAVAENPNDPKTSDIQYPWTWTTNCRKSIKKDDIPDRFFNEKGKVKSGRLEDFNKIFENLRPEATIGEVLEKFESREKGFDTKDNTLIFEAWNLIEEIHLN